MKPLWFMCTECKWLGNGLYQSKLTLLDIQGGPVGPDVLVVVDESMLAGGRYKLELFDEADDGNLDIGSITIGTNTLTTQKEDTSG